MNFKEIRESKSRKSKLDIEDLDGIYVDHTIQVLGDIGLTALEKIKLLKYKGRRQWSADSATKRDWCGGWQWSADMAAKREGWGWWQFWGYGQLGLCGMRLGNMNGHLGL